MAKERRESGELSNRAGWVGSSAPIGSPTIDSVAWDGPAIVLVIAGEQSSRVVGEIQKVYGAGRKSWRPRRVSCRNWSVANMQDYALAKQTPKPPGHDAVSIEICKKSGMR